MPATMADSQQPSRDSRSGAFIRGAGNVDPENKMWWPARWVAQMVQYLVAIVVITIAEGFKAIVSGEKPKGRRSKQ
ncbi:hypothetical protein CLAFUW4_04742 [Fulvia fulva]|uniref:Uncharacterized protein n=1 Tax=Passalora fulva TaxID=5499 RepID=A0A9Q8UUH8_PASFU|nr:uncharacterized protein CLAFUR5_12157 [Fulvia fulva]KAK4627051.1 hypothetical protein CLAFUR4_04728 [Fulvia fulva]KAK4627671.1 hypothetical protein CLAFUR0_04732 [Fulvia fulva]UJO22812.1 hypothetical protein CLAFUR5_12157 [Fulvia fulva]WPV13650.1 hypothetical protein CLAFUW4_04742 [Fulvia fulva]WPV28920.1 hypothetical protein CLAFUW7_04736 [Fulvia fulva]